MDDQRKDLVKETPKATYNKITTKNKDDPLSRPRNPRQPANLKAYELRKDPEHKPSGNIAQQFQTVSNMCILGETYVRRVTVDCGTELPEVIIR